MDVKPPVSDQDARALALESLLAFNRAVQAKNFASFHKQLANVWQKGDHARAAAESICGLHRAGGQHLAQITGLQPVFDPAPAFDEDGFLLLKGYYPTRPNRVHFKLRYIQEAGRGSW